MPGLFSMERLSLLCDKAAAISTRLYCWLAGA